MPSDGPENQPTAHSDLKIALGPAEMLNRTTLPGEHAAHLASVPMVLAALTPAAAFALLWKIGVPWWACLVMSLVPFLTAVAATRIRSRERSRRRLREIRVVLDRPGADLPEETAPDETAPGTTRAPRRAPASAPPPAGGGHR